MVPGDATTPGGIPQQSRGQRNQGGGLYACAEGLAHVWLLELEGLTQFRSSHGHPPPGRCLGDYGMDPPTTIHVPDCREMCY